MHLSEMKYSCLFHNIVTSDVDYNILTAYCYSFHTIKLLFSNRQETKFCIAASLYEIFKEAWRKK